MCFMAINDGWSLPGETPTWDGPYFGLFGLLAEASDGEAVQCHVCGDWYVLLGTHANATHGLHADAYRRAFGLHKSTALASTGYRTKRRRHHSAQLVTPERLEATRARAEALSSEEMQRRSRMKRRRRQHDLETWTEPTRTQAALTARYGAAVIWLEIA